MSQDTREQRLEACLNFFASVIKSGEPWTPTCQTAYEMARVYDNPSQDTPVQSPTRQTLDEWWQDHLDKNDRNSPEEYPEMALITFEELAEAVAACAPAPAPASQDTDALRSAGRPAQGWSALAMACTECDHRHPDPECWACNGSGIRENSHTVNDGLFVDGHCIAKVEAFADDGPWYANAIDTAGNHVRGGPKPTHADAVDWCEAVSGYRITPKAVHDARTTAAPTEGE